MERARSFFMTVRKGLIGRSVCTAQRTWKARSEPGQRPDKTRITKFQTPKKPPQARGKGTLGRGTLVFGICTMSVEASRGEFVLVPAEVVAQLMEVGQADLLAIGLHVGFGEIPQALEIEDDLS